MNLPVNKFRSNQPELLSKRSDKKRVNISWSHSLFFQVGLIISLITVFFVMESAFGVYSNKPMALHRSLIEEPYIISDFVLEVPKLIEIPKAPIVNPRTTIATRIFSMVEAIPNNALIETQITSTEFPIVDEVPVIREPILPIDEGKPKNINSVEFVPVYPGCESLDTNKEKIACMSSKIGEFIQNKFRTDKFNDLDPDEIYKVYVKFTIDASGAIKDVIARAANSKMEDEGIRVVERLPKMVPGKQGDVNVNVMYMLPIVFKVN
jgi:protein TonB